MRPFMIRASLSLFALVAAVAATAQDAPKPTPEKPVAAPPHAPGHLVEGEKVNPYTYEPKSVAGDANDPAQADLSKSLDALGPVSIEWYQHVQTLSNPFFEGRAPGTRGNELAGEYVQHWMKQVGLQPAFKEKTADGKESPSWFQPFELQGGSPQVDRAVCAAAGKPLVCGTDFQVIGSSGSGAVSGPVAFAGYAIEKGRDDYTSFGAKEDLSGKVVVFLRYEPLDKDGHSKWSDRRFSGAASMRNKLDALADRKPAALVMVNPPECKDGATGLEATESSVFGPSYDFPIVQLSQEAADALLRKADAKGRGLMDFRRLADDGAIKVESLKADAPVQVE
ncbi:MAG: hypothetical protein ACKPEA_13695, partial [Planctomycetota bacterium]